MKKILLIVFILGLGVFIFLFATGRIDLKNINKAAGKILEPVIRPVKIKEKTQDKLDKMEEEWQEKHDELLDDVSRYK